MYKYFLFPGRHHAITNFQVDYIRNIFDNLSASDTDGNILEFEKPPVLVWAITSGNHANTQRNPLPGYRRLSMAELVSQYMHFSSQAYLIPNMNLKQDFAHYVLEEVRIQSKGNCDMDPSNTVVASSTPDVIEQFKKLGFKILPVELDNTIEQNFLAPRPWDVVEQVIKSGDSWEQSQTVNDQLHQICKKYYLQYSLANHINDIFKDPLTDDDGDITDTRDYETYRASFEENAYRKVEDFAEYVQPGRIVDVGCATGQTIKLLTERSELFESDFYGIEAARPLYDICKQRQHNGIFGDANVFFYQRNIMHSEIFPENSVNTAITMALTHEIESYMGRASLLDFIDRIFRMLSPGGVYINYDVAGPDQKDEYVWVEFNKDDGINPKTLDPPEGKTFVDFLENLSSQARFKRFVSDFRKEEGDTVSVRYETIEDTEYTVLKYGDLCDFLAKKDYTDSWFSEMHERFCFWNYSDWAEALIKAGFEIHSGSKSITNSWLIDNRFAPAAKVFRSDGDKLLKMDHPQTNIMLVAIKP